MMRACRLAAWAVLFSAGTAAAQRPVVFTAFDGAAPPRRPAAHPRPRAAAARPAADPDQNRSVVPTTRTTNPSATQSFLLQNTSIPSRADQSVGRTS